MKIITLIQLLLLQFFEFAISRSSRIFGVILHKHAISIASKQRRRRPPPPAPPPAPLLLLPPPLLLLLIVTVSKFYVNIIYGYVYATSYFPDQLSSSLFRNFASSVIRQ